MELENPILSRLYSLQMIIEQQGANNYPSKNFTIYLEAFWKNLLGFPLILSAFGVYLRGFNLAVPILGELGILDTHPVLGFNTWFLFFCLPLTMLSLSIVIRLLFMQLGHDWVSPWMSSTNDC